MALRTGVGCVLMVVVLWWVTPPEREWLAAGVWERAWWLTGVVLTGAAVYLGAVWASGGRISHLLHRA
jgi:putative peptidoglycan lipid II flippase